MSFQGDSIYWVEVEKIVPNPFQPRREFDEDRLKELAESIRMYGVLQPLTVTKREIQRDDGAFYSEYELIAGERRWRASKLAGLAQVPVIIRSGEQTEQEKLELAIIENLQREDLNAVDRALAFKQLADVFNLSHAQVAKKVGRSREYVTNSIRILALPEYMLNSVKLGDISEGHARTLLMLKDRPEEQDVVYREILLKKLSVREVERIARKIAVDKVRKKDWLDTDAHLIEIEKEFTDTLGTRVQISKTDYGGKLTIDYFSEEDLQKILAMLRAEQQAVSDPMFARTAPTTPAPDSARDEMALITHATALTVVPPAVVDQVLDNPTVQSARVPMEHHDVTLTPVVAAVASVTDASPAPASADVLNADEFAFIREQAERERRKDDLELVVPYADEEPVVAPTPIVAPTTPDPILAQSSDDDDLYSLKNFSL